MKLCNQCGKSKPLASFQSKGDGSRRGICRQCKRSRVPVAKVVKPPPTADQCRCYKLKVAGKSKCQDCLDQAKAHRRKLRLLVRREVISHYGGECVYCGNDEVIFLTIDHINGGGNRHRKEAGEPNICMLLYKQQRADGRYPNNYQVTCWGCNSAKHIHGEEAVRAAVARLKAKNSNLPGPP